MVVVITFQHLVVVITFQHLVVVITFQDCAVVIALSCVVVQIPHVHSHCPIRPREGCVNASCAWLLTRIIHLFVPSDPLLSRAGSEALETRTRLKMFLIQKD